MIGIYIPIKSFPFSSSSCKAYWYSYSSNS